MSFQLPPADVPVLVSVAGVPSAMPIERRVTPSWTVQQLKAKLETMTGISPDNQKLKLKAPGRDPEWIENDNRPVGDWRLVRGCEIEIHDQRPAAARIDFNDLSAVEKYELPKEAYEKRSDSVLAWKKNEKLGRFNPNATPPDQLLREAAKKDEDTVKELGIEVSKRAILVPSSPPYVRRGTIRYVGPIPEIPSQLLEKAREITTDLPPLLWVGVELDEPTGRNDGSIEGKRYFDCLKNRGVFVKPEKVEVGDFPPLELDMEELEEM